MNILLIDDHALFREGLRHVLRMLGPAVDVVEAADGRGALELLRKRDDLDLVLLDLALPDTGPFEVLQASRRLQPQVPVVVLSANEDRFEIGRALALGAQAYVFKSSSSQIMLGAVRRVINGEIVVPSMGEGQPPWDSQAADRAGALTERQIDVLRMLSRGLSNKEIGQMLGVAENTVKVHLANIYRALEVSSRTGALLKAFQIGLLDDHPGQPTE